MQHRYFASGFRLKKRAVPATQATTITPTVTQTYPVEIDRVLVWLDVGLAICTGEIVGVGDKLGNVGVSAGGLDATVELLVGVVVGGGVKPGQGGKLGQALATALGSFQ